MQTRTVEQVESWDARPFSGGFHELHELSDSGFSGAVVADDTWLFFLNGRVVGVFQGDIDDVEDASGTIYEAPDPSLPLLFSMQERGGETQAKYFTNDTSIAEANETLQDANFTGYLELSENVLSGDYYVSYYGGKSMSTAFVGQSERLVTGEDAFERANDEVGVFEVRKVSMNITEIPSPSTDETSGTTAGAVADSGADSTDDGPAAPTEAAESVESDESEVDATAAGPTAEPGDEPASPDRPVTVEEAESDAPEEGGEEPARADPRSDAEASAEEGPSTPPSTSESSVTDSRPSTEEPAGSGDDESAMSDHERAVREWAAKDRDDADDGTDHNLFREEAAWRQTKSIPALDPDESDPRESTTDQPSQSTRKRGESRSSRDPTPKRQSSGSNETRSRSGGQNGGRTRSDRQSGVADRLDELRSAVEARDRRIEELESKLSSVQTDRDELEETVTELREERSALESRIEELESALETARESGASGDASAETDVPADEALSGTNLFVRYESKGQPTLSALDEGSVDPAAVNDNLRLEHHTQFDLEGATVGGRDFESFLHDSSRYRFVEWLVRAFPYELRDSGATAELQDVYEAVPDFDRIEFDGSVDVETDAGETATHTFDVVVRDRMGDPLVVASINDSRDPVRSESMGELIAGASTIGESVESLAGAFYVTASFFEPGALEAAQEASSEGGFFSRTDRESYVKVSRKRGYHLCLVEDRHDAFHLTVPEL
ncbi:MAG: DUF7527 domain-containing protein [Halanaeroarchaeum sp.]